MEQNPDSPAARSARSAASLEASPEPGQGADLKPAPQAEAALMPQDASKESAPEADSKPAFDAHGFDPADYKWVPVRRKPRKDGWTPQRQQDFIAALAESGCVEHAAMKVSMSPSSCYRLRRSPGGESFARAWDVALRHAAEVLLDTAFDRAFRGSNEPVFDREGQVVGRRHRQNDRLTMFLLRAYMPERFRHAHRDTRAPDEALPPPTQPMEQVLRRLEPVPPPAPHRLMAPDELEDAVLCADILDGELSHIHRGKGDAEPPFAPRPEVQAELDRSLHGDESAGE